MNREKNMIHHVLESCGIKLSSVLADIFGKSANCEVVKKIEV
jgi:hypothetical protein